MLYLMLLPPITRGTWGVFEALFFRGSGMVSFPHENLGGSQRLEDLGTS